MDLPLLLSLQQQCIDQMNDCGIGGEMPMKPVRCVISSLGRPNGLVLESLC